VNFLTTLQAAAPSLPEIFFVDPKSIAQQREKCPVMSRRNEQYCEYSDVVILPQEAQMKLKLDARGATTLDETGSGDEAKASLQGVYDNLAN
jgi:hypothetical protein